MTSINDQLNQHIETNYDGPNDQAEAVRSHFSQEKYKDFLRKIRDHKDFFASRNNDSYRVVVNNDTVLIDERFTIEDEIPVGRVFPFNHIWKPRIQEFWPENSNMTVFIDEKDHVNVIVNDVFEDLDKALEFVDSVLFESK